MIVRFLILCFCFGWLNAQDSNTTKESAYINILSNVKDTTVYINGEMIGETPIYRYELKPNVDYFSYAFADKRFYKEDISKVIQVKSNTIPTVYFEFEKAQAEVFLVGEDGELFLDNKFYTNLHARNRVLMIDAGENIKFQIKNGYKEIVFFKEIYADTVSEITYELVEIPLDIRLYTQTIENNMWEDTKEAANTPIEWEKAKIYCEDLRLGGFDDWSLPTLGQLKHLHQHYKEKIYNGFGGVLYWSSETFSGKNNIWQYAKVINTDDGKEAKSIQEFKEGRVRCVRSIDDTIIPEILNENNETVVPVVDTNVTQNLEQYLLK